MSIARVGALAAVAVGILLTALLMFGVGSSSYLVTGVFENASQLVSGNQVLIGGKSVGRITSIKLSDDNRAEIEMEIDDEFAPLHDGSTATIRLTSLSGVANRYVSINPGPNNAPRIPDGGRLGQDQTTAAVDVDQLLSTFDADTRVGLRRTLQQFGATYLGNTEEASQAFKYFGPFVSSASQVFGELTADQEAFKSLVSSSSSLLSAIAERHNDLSQLVHNGSVTARAIGQQNRALAAALGLLPSTLRQANTTFVNLRSAVDDLEPLLSDIKPTADDLAEFLRELRGLVETGKPTIHDLSLILRKKGANNDLINLLRTMPSVQKQARPAFSNSISALKSGQPIIEFLRPYSPDLTGFLQAFAGGAANYDANGHYVRVQPLFFNFSIDGDEYVPVAPADRLNQLQRNNVRRCPGGASQPANDGSSPFRDGANFDCDPSITPPGP